MFSLARISLVNWYLVGAKDIDIRGEAALIGPTGAGKSSIQDAIQTVITGANGNRLALNASASGRSSRSVLEYCLGMTGDPSEDGRPLRASCETILALTFRDGRDGTPITVGLALAARLGDAREEVLSRFVLPGLAFSVEDLKREADGVATVAPWSEIAAKLRAACPAMEEHKTSAERFTQGMLAAMRGPGRAPNPRHFLRAFSNALAFKPIFDPTLFVRDFVLEPDPLDVERVRTSIATWREFERLIRDAETQHRQAAAVSVLFADWARDHRAGVIARWRAASFEARRAAHEVAQAGATLRARSAELETERRVLASRREWIRGWDEEIRAKSALLAAADGEARLGRIDAEAGLAARDLADGERVFAAVSGALRELARLGAQFPGSDASATDAAREAVALIGQAPRFPEVLRGRGDRLQALADAAGSTAGWQGALDEEADRLAEEIRRHQGELDRIEAAPARPGGLLLSREVAKLLAALEREGIPAFPLCEVVEVADASWQYAAEALLGRGREAIVVQPPLLARAFDVMWGDRNSFSGCTLVKTSATASTRAPVPAGSILEALSTQDPHARAFLAVRIGAFRKAETEAELDRLERGVMRNGKTSSGMGLTVQRDLRELLFGRAAADAGLAGREAERERLRRTVAGARARIAALRNAGRSLASLAAVLRAQPDLADLEEKALQAQRRREVLQAERRQASASDSGALRAEIEDIRAERDGHLAELREEVEPLVEALGQAVASGRAKLGVAREKLGEAVRARRAAWGVVAGEEHRSLAAVARDGADDAGAGVRLRAEIATLEEGAADAKGLLALRRNEAKGAAETARESARRRQIAAVRELADHLSRWRAEGPRVETEGMAAAALWIAAEVRRLETNELIGYRERCAEAGAQMRAILREDLLSRLAEKLERVSHRLAGINRLLKRHRFTGQTYAFTHAVDGRFARMHELAVRSAAGELTEDAFAASMDEVEALIEGAEEAALLADYRRYFTFEIVMTDECGARTTLSSRALKGSGGEAQVPFYVAIAASLALAYFPGHVAGRPVGMGLALFDEAFNKLDVPNTQALLRFFRDMGLQLLIAGPEDKRATFTEVLDTIVLVNKSLDGRSVYIDTEHPGEAARDALSKLNPDHLGIEGFRSAAE